MLDVRADNQIIHSATRSRASRIRRGNAALGDGFIGKEDWRRTTCVDEEEYRERAERAVELTFLSSSPQLCVHIKTIRVFVGVVAAHSCLAALLSASPISYRSRRRSDGTSPPFLLWSSTVRTHITLIAASDHMLCVSVCSRVSDQLAMGA